MDISLWIQSLVVTITNIRAFEVKVKARTSSKMAR